VRKKLNKKSELNSIANKKKNRNKAFIEQKLIVRKFRKAQN